MFYPALLLVGTFGAYYVVCRPVVLIVVRWSELLGVLLVLNVFGWHLRRIRILLQEGVKTGAAFVLFD